MRTKIALSLPQVLSQFLWKNLIYIRVSPDEKRLEFISKVLWCQTTLEEENTIIFE